MLTNRLNLDSHSRFNPLTGDWVLVSPHRLQRPWQGDSQQFDLEDLPAYDPDCYLCPGNKRANGETNPTYESILTFDNDFPALRNSLSASITDSPELFTVRPEAGRCMVICFDPSHNRTLAELGQAKIKNVINAWMRVNEELSDDPEIGYVEIFENKGAMMGCSNPHPHCQVWATSNVPVLPARENDRQFRYNQEKGNNLLRDYLDLELSSKERIVSSNDDWVVLVPFWAVWPFETMLLPRFNIHSLFQLSERQQNSLAAILKDLLERYDRLFGTSMPYSMGWHGAPTLTQIQNPSHWTLHAHYYPPLLRSATVRKFLVGFEMLAQAQRDITPESAAVRLRDA